LLTLNYTKNQASAKKFLGKTSGKQKGRAGHRGDLAEPNVSCGDTLGGFMWFGIPAKGLKMLAVSFIPLFFLVATLARIMAETED
jgi:hypothetical protein